MGSPTVSNAKPIPMERSDKNTLLTRLKNSILPKKKEKQKHALKQEIETKKDNVQSEKKKETKPKTGLDAVLDKFNKLDLQEKKKTELDDFKFKVIEKEDDIDDFQFKVIEKHRDERIHSHSSQDSGYSDKTDELDNNNVKNIDKSAEDDDKSEKIRSSTSKDSGFVDKLENTDKFQAENVDKNVEAEADNIINTENDNKCDEIATGLENLDLSEGGESKRRIQKIYISRQPMKSKKVCDYSASQPYPSRDVDPYRQIRQINHATLTGGQVIVNQCQLQPGNLSEVDIACETVRQKSQYLPSGPDDFDVVLEYIHEETANITPENKMAADQETRDFLADLEKKTIRQEEIIQLLQDNNYHVPNPIENIVTNIETEVFNFISEQNVQSDNYFNPAYTYPTPPRSENVPSPMSASPGSFYPSTNSDYGVSPGRSPISNSDYEKYQYIPTFDEEKEAIDKKARERTASVSSMTMKQFKDLQKEIVNQFSKKDCCQPSRKSCKELFMEHMQKLKMAERKELCLKVAKMDLKTAYGVLHHILLSLSRGSEQQDLECALFALVCERIMAQDSSVFTGDAGLSLLKAAALRCAHKPLLTRYLVQCIRVCANNAAPCSTSAEQRCIFHEVDALGDTLVIACARAGDKCADVLYELVNTPENELPLFKLQHNNSDGYTALHVAVSTHSAASPRLHVAHVLLEHAGLKLTDGDLKGRDTALHLAVNSANCDLQMILLMFKQVDRKEWKNLAHCANLSNKTPIDLARLATKSTSRPNYPPEVLDFLKKCR